MAIVKVFGQPASVCTARVCASLEEKCVEYEQVPISFPTGEHKKQPYLSKNPFGQVPAFQDGDLILFESRAIARYVARKNKKGTDLLRDDSVQESALVEVWMEVESQQYNPVIGPIVMQSVIIPKYGGTPDVKLISSSAEKLGKVLDVYEDRLSRSKYLAGDFFSLADLNHLPLMTYYLMLTPHASLITSRPHVKAWWEELLSRPASKKVTAKMFDSK